MRARVCRRSAGRRRRDKTTDTRHGPCENRITATAGGRIGACVVVVDTHIASLALPDGRAIRVVVLFNFFRRVIITASPTYPSVVVVLLYFGRTCSRHVIHSLIERNDTVVVITPRSRSRLSSRISSRLSTASGFFYFSVPDVRKVLLMVVPTTHVYTHTHTLMYYNRAPFRYLV